MLALRKLRPGFGLELQEATEPAVPGPGEAIVRVECVGICGSDVHAYEWTDGYGFMEPHLPLTMGHEFAGVIAAIAPGTDLAVGARVAVMPAVTCGHCASCRRGDAPGCTNRRSIGLSRDGGFASRVRVPAASLLPLPEAIDAEVGALIEPLAVAADAVLVGEVGLGDTVLVLGPGTIGQGIALMARAAGAGRVIVAGRADAPRFDVLRRLGLPDVVDVAEGPLADQVLALTGGRPVDVVLEATGHPPSVVDGLGVLRKGGVLVVAGIHAENLSLPLTVFVRNRHQLRASHSTRRATWDRVAALVAREPETYRALITHRLPLARALDGFELARQRVASKVMLRP